MFVSPNNLNVFMAAVTFTLFFTEALIHYNVGLNAKRLPGEPFKFGFPRGGSLLKIVGVLLFFSVVNSLVTSFLIESAEGHSLGAAEPGPAQPRHLHYASSPFAPSSPSSLGTEAPHIHLP